jgi:hypothetical protein
MNRRSWLAGIGLLWFALPAIALQYWLVWDHLPANLATHFDGSGRPNGWMTRDVSLFFMLGMTAFMLIVATLVLTRVRKPSTSSYALLGMFYVIVGVLYRVSGAVLDYNLYGRPVDVVPVIVTVFGAVFVLIVIMLGAERGASLPDSGVVAEEVHSSPAWALFFTLILAVEVSAAALVPIPAVRFALGLVCLLFVVIAAHAWSGFRYQFRASGLEIRTLGFRLRSIPAAHIKEYAVSRWSPLGGYGIRGIGERRAYVWGNKGVRVKLTDGEVFLGHSEPERIVHDLDVIKQFAH